MLLVDAVAVALFAVVANGAGRGRALVERFECARCHDGVRGAKPFPRVRHCVECHAAIADGSYDAPPAQLAAWRANLFSLRAVPTLADLSNRLDREWIASYLVAPHDLRPSLNATMPRLAIEPEEARAIARYLAPDQRDAPEIAITESSIARGSELYDELGCARCHAFSGVREGPPRPTLEEMREMSEATLLAPDLAHSRARMRPSWIARTIESPSRTLRGARMPEYGLARGDAEALAAFIARAELRSLPPAPPSERLPLLTRTVRFEEVQKRIFQKTCRHCHADPEKAFGDGGPGNTGGFGYRGKGLMFATYRGVSSGSVGEDGRRRSIFAPREADGTPRVIAHLLARRSEERGDPIPGVVGMPLGLPSLGPEELQLLESWIAQGRPN
jgi:cytochrome c2